MALETDRNPPTPTLPQRWLAAGLGAARAAGAFFVGVVAPAIAARWSIIVSSIARTPVARYLSGTLLRRILFTNILSFLILIGGLLYLSASHGWLLEAKRDSLQKQGQIIAAAIGENVKVDALPNMSGGEHGSEPIMVPYRDDGFAALEFSLSPERVTPILNRIIRPTDARARIYDRGGNLVVDTASLLQKGRAHVARPEPRPDADRPRTRTLATRLTAWLIDGELPVYKEIGSANGNAYPEVRDAINGKPNAVLLLDDDGEQIVAIAEPIRRAKSKTVQGVLFLSTRPGAISSIINEERQVILTLAAFAFLAMLVSSWMLARTVAEPIRKLSDAADHVSRSITARAELPNDPNRRDEVGQLAAAFRTMTASLYRRIEASEKFAADVAHELKNPLAAARSTAEALNYAKTDEQREQLVQQVQFELKRLNRLINDVSNASRLDAELARQKVEPVDLKHVIEQVQGIFDEVLSNSRRRVEFTVDAGIGDGDAIVEGHDGRLAQVLTNLIDNAVSFSPEDGVVRVRLRRSGDRLVVTVSDQGPGIPADRLETIFERFYSDRPQTDQSHGKNSGLGLSISREIVIAHRGRIYAENIYDRAGQSELDAATASESAGASDGSRGEAAGRARSGRPEPIGARFTIELPARASDARRSLRNPGNWGQEDSVPRTPST